MNQLTADDDSDVDGWGAKLLFGTESSAAPIPRNSPDETVIDERVELDEPVRANPQAAEGESRTDIDAGAKKTGLVLMALLAVAVVAVVATLAVFGRPNASPPPRQVSPTTALLPSAAPTTQARPPDQDQAVPFTASANCPEGSTSAQALTDTASDSAWICVRGAPGGQVDGQVLHIDLGHSYVLSAVSVTPGAVPKTPGGNDDWLSHRVVSRLQYNFNDGDRTVFTQNTGNTHGPVTAPLPTRVLASRVTVIILQTARPPASPLPGTTASQPGLVASVLGTDPAAPEATPTTAADSDPAQSNSDPVDATFAISAMTFFGHRPA